MLLKVSVEEDYGALDISSIKLVILLEELEVILFILLKKMDQKFLNMEPLLLLLESILLPKDQAVFQMLSECSRVETFLKLHNLQQKVLLQDYLHIYQSQSNLLLKLVSVILQRCIAQKQQQLRQQRQMFWVMLRSMLCQRF